MPQKHDLSRFTWRHENNQWRTNSRSRWRFSFWDSAGISLKAFAAWPLFLPRITLTCLLQTGLREFSSAGLINANRISLHLRWGL